MTEVQDFHSRKKRKEEAKLLKRKRIQESGGKRPRATNNDDESKATKGKTTTTTTTKTTKEEAVSSVEKERELKPYKHPAPKSFDNDDDNKKHYKKSKTDYNNNHHNSNSNNTTSFTKKGSSHRFGRVMETVPCRNKPRYSTVSIAIPGSVVSNCQTRELKTHLVGQIARAATIYHIDEIVVFDDKLASSNDKKGFYNNNHNRHKRQQHSRDEKHDMDKTKEETATTNESVSEDQQHSRQQHSEDRPKRSDPHTFMARVLQYCECPQYLRRNFFPMHPDLQFTGLLSPIDAPHHVRAEDRCKYREGVVMDRKGNSSTAGSLVNCGIRNRPVEIDRVLTPGIRCTVQLDIKAYGSASSIKGTVVSPSTPREDNGSYWGYTTRLADSINDVFDSCPFEGGYDLKIGTSERGDRTVDDKKFSLPKYKHTLIVFGGVAGIEECVDADETCKIPGSQSRKLFDVWVNTCPYQGSRTIRTEEAVLLSLARLSPFLASNEETKDDHGTASQSSQAPVTFSDDEISEESESDAE